MATNPFKVPEPDARGSASIGKAVKINGQIFSKEDLYVDGSGTIKTVVISVGGFLGVGAKDVAVKWSDLKQSRDGKSVVLTTNLSKDDLKALPDYKYERRQATAPDSNPRTLTK